MKILEKISDNEVVAEFLKAESGSPRWKGRLKTLLEKANIEERVLEKPDLKNEIENKQRERILATFRGWKQNAYLFTNFPSDIEWHKAILNSKDLKKIKYMNYDYWNELSQNTRLVIEGARAAKNGVVIYGQSNEGFQKVAQYIKGGGKFPKLIFVAANPDSDLILLEGHLRATAMMWDEKEIPRKTEVVVGFSEGIKNWNKD